MSVYLVQTEIDHLMLMKNCTQLGVNVAYYKTHVDEKLATKLDKSEDTVSGEIDVNKNRIVNVKSPQETNDAANMDYVDSLIRNVIIYPLTHNLNCSNRRIHFVGRGRWGKLNHLRTSLNNSARKQDNSMKFLLHLLFNVHFIPTVRVYF